MPTLIQIASPYDGMRYEVGMELEDEEVRMAAALDKWVGRIVEKYPQIKASWSILEVVEGEEGPVGPASEINEKILEMIDLLQRGLRAEIHRMKRSRETHKAVLKELLQAIRGWYDERELLQLLRDAYGSILLAEGVSEKEVQEQLETFQVRGLIRELEQRVRTGKATGGVAFGKLLSNIRKHGSTDELTNRWKACYIEQLKKQGLSDEDIKSKLVRTMKLPNGKEKVVPLQIRNFIRWLEQQTKDGVPLEGISLEALFFMDKRSWYDGPRVADVLRQSYEKLLQADGLSEEESRRKIEQADDLATAMVEHLLAREDTGELTIEKLFDLSIHQWYDEAALTELLKEIYKRIADASVAEKMQADDLILELKDKLS